MSLTLAATRSGARVSRERHAMIVAHHIIFGAYGFWLPNDSRGSWSDFVGAWHLYRYGPATQVTDPRSHAWGEHNHALRLEAKSALKYPPVTFTGVQARAVARGFATYAGRSKLDVYGCAIMPDHVHLVIGDHRLAPDQIAIQLKASATRQLAQEKIHPLQAFPTASGRFPKAFARGQWKVYLDPDDVDRAVEYVRQNPLKEGMKEQVWKFVKPMR